MTPENLPRAWIRPVHPAVRNRRQRVIDWNALSWIGFATGCLLLAWLTAHR